MAKGKSSTVFYCQECGYESAKWMGQCPACRTWNSFVEEPVKKMQPETGKERHTGLSSGGKKPARLSEISADEEERISSGIGELDRVLGGGIVPGSLVLVGGDPGIGKSTLLLQVCRLLSQAGRRVLYVSGEESLRQIKMRAQRIGPFQDSFLLLCETNLSDIEEAILRLKPEAVIIDSIQTMFSGEVSAAPGSVSQVRESTGVFLRLAKNNAISIFIVGHVTKEGTVAGPRVLEHMVDTVLYFEGDRHASYRVLRAVKNRFGSTNEIGVFEMKDKGLCEVMNPSEYMLSGNPVVMYRLDGIPEEYHAYLNYVHDNSIGALRDEIVEICSLSNEEREKMVQTARKFLLKEKKEMKQAGKILQYAIKHSFEHEWLNTI